jgi:YesN/AraC family two-component response regulator
MKVIIIDDQPIARFFLKRIFEAKFNFQIIEAANGHEGLEKIKREKPDLVFTDIMMPLMDGTTLVQTMRSDPTLKEIPIVVMSSTSDKDIVRRMLSMGVSDYLLKPFQTGNVENRIEAVVQKIQNKQGN